MLIRKLILIVLFFISTFITTQTTKVSTTYATNNSENVVAGITNVGYAVFNLTAPTFNCNGFFEATKPLSELHVAFLYNTFGNDFRCLKRILEDPRLQTLEINLINEPGHRNRRLGSYEFLYSVGSVSTYNQKLRSRDAKLKAKFIKYVTPLQTFLDEHSPPNLNLLINPGLESNVSVASGRVLISWAREAFPTARMVWNPLRLSKTGLRQTKADLVESHGLAPKLSAPCVYNMDGADVSYPNRPAIGEKSYQEGQTKNWIQSGPPLRQIIEEYANKCEVAFIWSAEGNGINPEARGFVDPRKRNNKISTNMYKTIMRDIIHLQKHGRVAPMTEQYSELDNSIVNTCDAIRVDFYDGYKTGRLLKQSEFRGRGGVVLLDKELKSADRVFLIQGNRVVDTYQFTANYKDGTRSIFRSNKSPTTYPFKTYLVVDVNSRRTCFKILNPRIRND